MTVDICNASVSLQSTEALTSWNTMIHAFLAHGTATPQHLGATLEADPDFAMAHAARGLFSLMLGRAEMWAVAEGALACCQRQPAPRVPFQAARLVG